MAAEAQKTFGCFVIAILVWSYFQIFEFGDFQINKFIDMLEETEILRRMRKGEIQVSPAMVVPIGERK